MSFSCGSVWFFHNWYCRHCALGWLHVISPMTCSQPIRWVYACACVAAILSTNSVSQTGGELCGFGTTLTGRYFTGHIVNAMCEIESTCNSTEHVKPIMTDYQDLLQTIKSLQHSRLSYIELLQEEVKRSQDVSSDLQMARSSQIWYHHIPSISNFVLLGFLIKFKFTLKSCTHSSGRGRE